MGVIIAKVIAYLVITILLDVGSYFFAREILWSIALCDKKTKRNVSAKRLVKDASVFGKVTMLHLKKQINVYKKEFSFWFILKTIFIVCEVVFVASYIVFYFTIPAIWGTIAALTLSQSFIWLFVFAIQFRHKFLTKYDVIRLKRKK